MKIIAKTKAGFLLDATKTELLKIKGVSSATFTIGNTFDVGLLWNRLQWLKEHKAELAATAKKLADFTETIED